jgi:ATP-binding cassette subfamily B protein
MSDQTSEAVAEGRPSVGAELAQSLVTAAQRREKSRNVRALGRLLPFARNHLGDAALALVFLIVTASTTLGISGALRLLVDHLTAKPAPTTASIAQWFLLLGAVAVTLAVATALRYFFVTKLGERVVADLRKAVYAHILTLDPAFWSCW